MNASSRLRTLVATKTGSYSEGLASSYRADIDGLRAIAIISVVMFHAGIWPFRSGFAGVDVFFAISGYLIGGIILREAEEGRFSVLRFYERRARRILPALFCVVGCSYLAAFIILTPSETLDFARSAVATIFAISNFKFWWGINYFAPVADTKPLLMTWSLGVEEQFYLFWPFVLLAVVRRTRVVLVVVLSFIVAASLLLSVWMTHWHPTNAFFLLPSRAWELGLGTLAAIAKRPLDRWLVGHRIAESGIASTSVVLIGLSLFGLDRSTPFPGYAALLPVFGTIGLLVTKGSWINSTILSLKPLTFVGRISYSWYLWHWPILCFAGLSTPGKMPRSTTIVLIAISFIMGIVSWRFVEQPFRKSVTPTTRLLGRYATGMLLASLAALPIMLTGGWPQRFQPELLRLDRAEREVQTDVCLVNYGGNRPSLASTCLPAANGHEIVALLGDSHAAALAPGWRHLAANTGKVVWQLTKSSCPSLRDVTRRIDGHPRHATECLEFNRRALAIVLSNPAIREVVLAGYWSAPVHDAKPGGYILASGDGSVPSTSQSEDNFVRGLLGLVDKIALSGRRVVVLTDVPNFTFDIGQLSETRLIPARQYLWRLLVPGHTDRSGTDQQAAPLSDKTEALLKHMIVPSKSTRLVDLGSRFCSNGACRFRDASNIFFVDNQHLAEAGADFALAGDRSLLDGIAATDAQISNSFSR